VPVPASFTLANGMTVLLNDRPGIPFVSATLVVKTGSGANPPGKPGLASFTAAMIDEGTTTRSALQIANEVAQIGGTLTTTSSADSMQASASSLARNFPQMLTLLADVVRRPSFPADEVERQRASRLAQLQQQREDANAIASVVTAAALYGPSHPYGFSELGTVESTKAATADDMRAFWSKHFVPNNAALVVSGRISQAELTPLVQRAFGDWSRGSAITAAPTPAPSTTQAKVVFVDKPGASQSQLRAVVMAASRSTPDFESMVVMNDIFGGLFSSRINLNLREEHGYTYGARSQFIFRRSPGFFMVAAGVRTDVTAPALAEISKELTRIREGVTSEELTLAKDSIVRSLPAEFETSGRVSSTTANLFVYGLPLAYYTGAQRRYGAITATQVAAAARKYLVPEKLFFLVVGDRAKVGPSIDQLNLGPIEYWTPDGTRGTTTATR
jgi:zinc protease